MPEWWKDKNVTAESAISSVLSCVTSLGNIKGHDEYKHVQDQTLSGEAVRVSFALKLS